VSHPGDQFSADVEEALKERLQQAWRLLDESRAENEKLLLDSAKDFTLIAALKAALAQARKDTQNWQPALQSAEDECQHWKARCAELEGLLKENDVELIGLGVKFAERNQALRDEVTQLKKALEGR